ncbi:MAG TPA: TonB-dependent receptor [Vicinamibacterales bacterium]|nr:TonB-dependent receptor [Vicinamibacterales bacterium]
MGAFSRLVILVVACVAAAAAPALGQQRGTISGKVVDPGGLPLPGATITVTEQDKGFSRTVVSASTGAFTVPNLEPGRYTLAVEMSGFGPYKQTDVVLTAGSDVTLDLRLQLASLQEEVHVTGLAPLVDRSSAKVGGTLSGREIEEVPSNFRNFTALTQLIPGMTPNPAQSTFEGGQVVANGTVSQSNVYLIDGMYNNDDRLGGSQGTQVRVVLDNIDEYQVLANQYSAEYGGGAGAIINMVTRGGTNNLNGRAYAYFRDDKFNTRGHFLSAGEPKPDERTEQLGFALGGPIVRDRAHFYFTLERDHELLAGEKKFPAEGAPLVRDMVGEFEVLAMNYFARGDLQLNSNNFLSARWVLEDAPTKGEGFNVDEAAPDARGMEADWDQLFNLTFNTMLTDRASNVLRVGRISEDLRTGAQTFFDQPGRYGVEYIGLAGRDPLAMGQQNVHPSYTTGAGGTAQRQQIYTYTLDDSFSYFVPNWGGEHTFKFGGGYSVNSDDPRSQANSGVFEFDSDLPYDPRNPETYPVQFDIVVGPPGSEFQVSATDRRGYWFVEDKWRVGNNVTLNLGLRWDHQSITPDSKDDFAPRAGFAWDLGGNGSTVVRGGIGRFNSYMVISLPLFFKQDGVRTLFPTLSINSGNDTCGCILRPDLTTDTEGNLGIAVLSAAAQADIARRRDEILSGALFNRNPRIDAPGRQMPYQWGWSFGVSKQLGSAAAVTIDYVGNASRDQNGVIDINEPVNGRRPGPAVFDPNGELIPNEARGTNFARVLLHDSSSLFNGDYHSLQMSVVKRFANRWSGRLAYTLQKGNYVGSGNPDNRRVWLDNDLRADYGRFASDRRHVLAASGSYNIWRTLTVAAVLSAISGAPINETVGRDVNRDNDNTDRPIRGVDDATRPILSPVDSQGRAVINGIDGPGSFGLDMSVRYQIPLRAGLDSLDLFYDIFNLTNKENLVPPTGNRNSSNFMRATAARFARQMQFGVRVRF